MSLVHKEAWDKVYKQLKVIEGYCIEGVGIDPKYVRVLMDNRLEEARQRAKECQKELKKERAVEGGYNEMVRRSLDGLGGDVTF